MREPDVSNSPPSLPKRIQLITKSRFFEVYATGLLFDIMLTVMVWLWRCNWVALYDIFFLDRHYQEFLLFADATNSRIMGFSPDDSRSLTYLPLSSDQISRPIALDYDVVEGRVYWTDISRNTISRCFLNGSSFEDVVNETVVIPDGLAVDPVGRNLYWTDTGTNKLEVSKLDGSYRATLITRNLDQPRDIILDVINGSGLFCAFSNEVVH